MDKKLIGIDLGGTTTKFAIVNSDGEVQQRWSIQTDVLNDGNNIVPDIIETINHHLDMYGMKPDQFAGIGMGTPGSVNYDEGTVDSAFNLNWSRPVPVKKQIEDGVHMDVTLENDANVAALGERWQGAGNNAADVAFVTLGTGVGGGIILNGNIIHGNGGSAGEIGHMHIEKNGYLCTCGNHGCLETVASATGVVRVAHDLAEEYAGGSELKAMLDDGQSISAKDVFDFGKKSDELATMIVERVADRLGLALSIVADTLNPEYIVIGGGVSNAGQYLLDNVEKAYKKYVFSNAGKTTELKLATLGNEAGVIGAASLVTNN